MARPRAKIKKKSHTFYIMPAHLEMFKELVEQGKIGKINDGINLAVEYYFEYLKRCDDEELMKKAAKDEEFNKRTIASFSEMMDVANG